MKQAGRRDRYITINQTTFSQDSYGQPVTNLISTSNWWAEVVFRGSMRETNAAHQVYPERDLAFIIQHTNPTGSGGVDVVESDTITYDGDDYDIIGIEELGRLDGLRIFAKKRGQ